MSVPSLHRQWIPVAFAVALVSISSPAARGAPLPPPSSSLDRLALSLAGKLGPALEGRRVGSLGLLVQVRQPPGSFDTGQQQLVRLLRQLLLTRLRSLRFWRLGQISPRLSADAALAQGLGGGFALTLLVRLVITRGRVHLRARLYDTDRTIWGRLKGRRARLLTLLVASVRVDGAISSYLGRPVGKGTITCSGRWRLLGKHTYWAAAMGDVDGDARAELVLLRPDAVEIRRWSKVYGRFDRVATVPLSGPLAPVRPRLFLGTLVVGDLDGDRKADILARSSDYRTAVQISHKGGRFLVSRRFGGYPMAIERIGGRRSVAVGYSRTGRAEYTGRGLSWTPRVRARMLMPTVYSELRVAPVRRPGARAGFVYGVLGTGSRLTLRWLPGGRLIQRIAGAGRAFALGDLDGDGWPEVATTATHPFGTSDVVTVWRLGRRRRLCEVSGFEGSVTAVTMGDLYLDGRPRVVSVVWSSRRRRSYLLVTR